jgi:RNA polymerase sigma-B factor
MGRRDTGRRDLSLLPPATPRFRDGYEHLAPLFAERARLPADHPRQRRLRAELITGYLPVARNIARRYGFRGVSIEDLEQVAAVGLILAVDRFEPRRGINFLSFAIPTMTGEVRRYFRDRACQIRLPRRLGDLQSGLSDAVAELGQRNGRAPRPSEIARYLGIDVEVVLEALQAQQAALTLSLDQAGPSDVARGSDSNRFDAAVGRTEPEFELIEDGMALAPLLADLPDRERRIVVLRFFRGMTQTEIAREVGISQMHVSRLLARTLAQLRRRLVA